MAVRDSSHDQARIFAIRPACCARLSPLAQTLGFPEATMTSQKFVLGTIVGGVVLFVLGYATYGLALNSFFAANSIVAMLQTPVFWSLILGQLGLAALLTYVIGTSAGAGLAGGFKTGLIVGLLGAIGLDFTMYGTQPIMNLQGVVADVVVFTILMAVAGAAVGAVVAPGPATTRS